ncbi:protein O-GlcNAcase [Mangrovihabitans endophyticus]|uniref:GH84 domain-containing protein n=1 Tax=Mangrovihabitans endophyticus TaxID=1751298 RepID=A0A8J3FMC7_9ACTN|nr:protein O-GlcNAcase [Mangrovihabitans endophyticus]GGK74997.1 hypothetical protein GCM10012284_06230 [Mangrovihabitans endophyticus]
MSSSPPQTPPASPALALRGVVEGFYGPPWSPAERRAHLEFSARVGLNTFVYAPKDDPYHRERWREAYPADELARIADLAAHAHRSGVRFVYAISPGLDMRFDDDAEHRALAAKAAQLADAGVTAFALFFDDVPAELTHPADRERWHGPGGAGAAHGEACTRFVNGFCAPRAIAGPLLICPTDYAGCAVSDYRRRMAETAPPDALIAWTGRDIVVGTVTRDEIDRAAASYRRRLVLWDNFPVNDFDPSRLFLGPLTGRAADLAGSALVGVLANPMELAAPSRLPLATVAEWAADPPRYQPGAAARRALDRVAGDRAAALAPLVAACSAWPPGAPQDAELATAAADALAGSPAALETLTRRLTALGDGCRSADGPEELTTPLRPWLAAGAAMADAGLAAVRLLHATTRATAGGRGPTAAGPVDLWDTARRALDTAEEHYADVLRAIVPPFARQVLDRACEPAPDDDPRAPRALLLTAQTRSAGDEAITALLRRHGYAVRRCATPAPAEIAAAALVVVARGAAPGAVQAADAAGVPVLAWHGLVTLGLARRERVLMTRDPLRIVAPRSPGAGGLTGVVRVYSGPGKVTVAEPGPQAEVVAHLVDGDQPALVHYPAGAGLADGRSACAARTALFLATDGMAPWLLTADGVRLLEAAVARVPAAART